jgi:hypothetical protein
VKISVNVSGKEVRRRLQVGSVRAKTLAESTTRAYGQQLLQEVVRRAQTSPGPRRITGQYANSIQMRYTTYRNSLTVEVYSNEPYSARLEYGYSGIDSTGRYQFSAPYPHFRPAFEAVSEEFRGAMMRLRFV